MKAKSIEEERKVEYFLDENKILKRLYPILEDNCERSPEISESIIRRLAYDFNQEQMEMIIRMLEREIKVKEFNRIFFYSTLTALFAILAVIFTLLNAAIVAESKLGGMESAGTALAISALLLVPILIIITRNGYVSDKSYRRTNRMLVFVNLANTYKRNPEIL